MRVKHPDMLLSRVAAGFDDCPTAIGQGVPGHGTFRANTYLALRVTFLGSPVDYWDANEAGGIGYQVELYSTTSSVSCVAAS
jgi:hypothetical protein